MLKQDSPPLSMQFRLYMQGTLPHFPCSSDCACTGLSPTLRAVQIVHARDSPPLSMQFRLCMQGTLPHSPCSSDCACKGLSPTLHAVQIVHARGDSAWKQGILCTLATITKTMQSINGASPKERWTEYLKE